MSHQNNNEQLIRQIAEEMAWSCHNDKDSDSYAKLCTQLIPAARIAVEYAGKELKRFASITMINVDSYLKERGLIPEAGKDKIDETTHKMSSENNADRLNEPLNRAINWLHAVTFIDRSLITEVLTGDIIPEQEAGNDE